MKQTKEKYDITVYSKYINVYNMCQFYCICVCVCVCGAVFLVETKNKLSTDGGFGRAPASP